MVAESLSRRRVVRFASTGACMRWLIPPGADVAVQGCSADDIRLGNIVLLRDVHEKAHKFVAHRLVGFGSSGGRRRPMTKGDARLEADGTLEELRIVGRVVGVFRDGRFHRLDIAVWRPVGATIALLSRQCRPDRPGNRLRSFARRGFNGLIFRGIRVFSAIGLALSVRRVPAAWGGRP